VRLMKVEWEESLKEKDGEIIRLMEENFKLRKMLGLSRDVGRPTERGRRWDFCLMTDLEVLDELKKHENKVRVKDECSTQTENIKYCSIQIGTDSKFAELYLEDDMISSDKEDHSTPTHNLESKITYPVEEPKKPLSSQMKITTTPQSITSIPFLNKNSKAFSTLVHGYSKKNPIFSLKLSSHPQNFLPINTIHPEDEVELTTPPSSSTPLPTIFNNSHLQLNPHYRYGGDDGEGYYGEGDGGEGEDGFDFYGEAKRMRDQAVGESPIEPQRSESPKVICTVGRTEEVRFE
jgi:hypothetical protein